MQNILHYSINHSSLIAFLIKTCIGINMQYAFTTCTTREREGNVHAMPIPCRLVTNVPGTVRDLHSFTPPEVKLG